MTPMFAVGDICIWQNLTDEYAALNGTETTIIAAWGAGFDLNGGGVGYGPKTDTVWRGIKLGAYPHELRKKQPPATDDAVSRQAMLDCIERAKRGIEVTA